MSLRGGIYADRPDRIAAALAQLKMQVESGGSANFSLAARQHRLSPERLANAVYAAGVVAKLSARRCQWTHTGPLIDAAQKVTEEYHRILIKDQKPSMRLPPLPEPPSIPQRFELVSQRLEPEWLQRIEAKLDRLIALWA